FENSIADLRSRSKNMLQKYKAGYRRFKWLDAERNRPVWADVWFPTEDDQKETPMHYGSPLGEGSAISNPSFAADGSRFPLVVMSHGAFGSPSGYSWLSEFLARNGVIVLGIAHYGESWLYGADKVDLSAVTRLWVRPRDCSFALTQLLSDARFRS